MELETGGSLPSRQACPTEAGLAYRQGAALLPAILAGLGLAVLSTLLIAGAGEHLAAWDRVMGGLGRALAGVP